MENLKKAIVNNKIYIETALGYVLSVSGIFLTMKHGGLTLGLYWNTLFLFPMLFMLLIFYNVVLLIKKDGYLSRRILKYSVIYGWLFGICIDMGYQLQNADYTLPGIKGKLIIVFTGFCLSFFFLPVTYRLFRLAEGLYPSVRKREYKKNRGVKVFFISLIVMELCWLPVFLAFYPAVMSYDFHRQSQEALRGFAWFYEYQPLAHTFLIRQFFMLGSKLGDLGIGMAWYSVCQSLILASSVSACLVYVYKHSGIVPVIFWTAFFALLPFNPVLAMSVTKDIVFSAFFLLLLLIINRFNDGIKPHLCILFVLCGIINILFRGNAVYGLLFLIPAFLIAEKTAKRKLIYAAVTLIMIVCGVSSKTLIRTGMNAIPGGGRIEMYSVPIMQMVRVAHYQESVLSEEQEMILRKYINDCWGKYYPYISDGFKAGADFDALTGDQVELLKDYLKIGFAYPNDYIDAFLDLTAGYWFIDDKTHAEMLEVGDDTGLGLIYTFNGSKSSALPKGIDSKMYLPGVYKEYCHILNGNSYYSWPFISYLFKPALYLWILIYVMFVCIYRRNRKSVTLLAYPFFYLLTMLLGPCVNFRYVYPFILAAPLLISFALDACKNQERTPGE